jgi:rhodanese-related sulfurtransferase
MGFLSKLFGGDKDKAAPASKDKPNTASAGSTPAWATNSGVPQELTAKEVQVMLDSDTPPTLLDVREDDEVANFGRIPGSVHIPMHEIQGRQTELDHERHTVVYCASGMRSMEVGAYLLQAGFVQVSNMNGGFNGWNGPKETPGK